MTSGPTLHELKQQLMSILGTLEDQRILVVVDDLDRITPAEAVEMASAIKSFGDFPNVIYLLSYDEERLAELIRMAISGRRARIYGEDRPVSRPPASRGCGLSDFWMVDAELTKIFGQLTEHEGRRLSLAWHYVLQAYIQKPRDVGRLANSVSIAQSGLADYTDKIDLLLLEAVRLFEPGLYRYVRGNIAELAE